MAIKPLDVDVAALLAAEGFAIVAEFGALVDAIQAAQKQAKALTKRSFRLMEAGRALVLAAGAEEIDDKPDWLWAVETMAEDIGQVDTWLEDQDCFLGDGILACKTAEPDLRALARMPIGA